MIKAILMMATLAGPPIHAQSEHEITEYLGALSQSNLSFDERLRRVVDDSLGTAYADGPLGEGDGGKYDADPLVDLHRVDCVTFVEQTMALSVTSDYTSMVDLLQSYRYKEGKVDYENRNHFLISDWIRNNPFCLDLTSDLGVETTTVSRTTSRKDFFELVKAPGLGLETPDEHIDLAIIPTEKTADTETNLPGTALIVFVGKVDWLFALHCGLYVRDETGEGHLAHASSKSGKVIKRKLTDYMDQQKDRYLGFTAYEVMEPKG